MYGGGARGSGATPCDPGSTPRASKGGSSHLSRTWLRNGCRTTLVGQLAAKPGPRKPKIMPYDVDRSADHRGGLLGGHAAEVMHFEDLGKRLALTLESLERVLQFEDVQLPVTARGNDLDVRVPGNPALGSAPLGSAERARMIDQHLPHDPGHQRKKVRAIDERGSRIFEQFDERFVDQGRWLKRVPRPLAPHE